MCNIAGLVLIFSFGVVGTVATIMLLQRALDGARQEWGVPRESVSIPLTLPTTLIFWSQLEVNCMIICANLPAFATLWNYIRDRRRASVRGANATKETASEPKLRPYPSGSPTDDDPSSTERSLPISIENSTFDIDEEIGLVPVPSKRAGPAESSR